MYAVEVTQEEIAELLHFSKIAYAARCARIAWEEIAKYQNMPEEHKKQSLDALAEAEQAGKDTSHNDAYQVWSTLAGAAKEVHECNQEFCKLTDTMELLKRRPRRDDLADVILAALTLAISPFQPQGKQHAAADVAYEAYTLAREAGKYENLPTANFLGRAHESYERLAAVQNEIGKVGQRGEVGPEFFTHPPPTF